MWNSDFYHYSARARIQERAKKIKESKPRPRTMRLVRSRAEVRIENPRSFGLGAPPRILEARFILCDLTPDTLFLFTPESIAEGRSVSVTIEFPIRFYVEGMVDRCREFSAGGTVMTHQPFPYRTSIRLRFDTPEEALEVRGYSEELIRRCLNGKLR